MSEETPLWRVAMPTTIPRVRGVPMVGRTLSGKTIRGLYLGDEYPEDGAPSCAVCVERIGNYVNANARCLDPIVDIDDPQGFGYALRWLCQNGGDFAGNAIHRHLEGRTSDADRLALAKALAEIVRSRTKTG